MGEPATDLLEPATALSRSAGHAPVARLIPMAGGKNNRVFEAELADGKRLVLKSYFHDPRDPRDRLGAEWAFANHAWTRGVRNLAQPLAADPGRHLGLYGFLAGHKLAAGTVEGHHVEAAFDFVLAVNRPPRDLADLPMGSESCFALSEHVETVERRVGRLASADADMPYGAEARRLVAGRLAPVWAGVRARLEQAAADAPEVLGAPVADDEQVASPSDFGFHNALVDDAGAVAFLDFEYAGRDDPAKLVCDFFCQPEVPVPLDHFAGAVDRLVDGLGLPARHRARCAALLDLYRVKWTCIILNQFLPVGAARRAFAESEGWVERCAGQLAKAEAKLSEIGQGTWP